MDRYDILAVAGVFALVAGLFLVHPALLLVAAGWLAVTNAAERMS